jgi:peptidyl-tRNA hydrolase
MAQGTHAAFQFAVAFPEMVSRWHHESNYLVIVAAPDEDALAALAGRAAEEGIVRTIVREPDMDNQITAIAFQPGDEARRLLSQLPLALKEKAMT